LRTLATNTRELLLIESIVDRTPSNTLRLVKEDNRSLNQGLESMALIPSDSFVIEVLSNLGLLVYQPVHGPSHPEFHGPPGRQIFIGSRAKLDNPKLTPVGS